VPRRHLFREDTYKCNTYEAWRSYSLHQLLVVGPRAKPALATTVTAGTGNTTGKFMVGDPSRSQNFGKLQSVQEELGRPSSGEAKVECHLVAAAIAPPTQLT